MGRKAVSETVLTLLLVCMLTLAFSIQSTKVSGTIRIQDEVEEIWSYTSEHSVWVWYTIDMNGDNVPDFAAYTRGQNESGVVAVNGKNGSMLWTYSTIGYREVRVFDVSDLDGDGFGDVIVGAENVSTSTAYVEGLDGKTGNSMWRYEATYYLSTVCTSSDLDGDGLPDVVLCSNAHVQAEYEVKVHAIDGKTGNRLWLYSAHDNVTGVSVFPNYADLNGDGTQDVAAGESVQYGTGGSYITVLDGSNGTSVWSHYSDKRLSTRTVVDVSGDHTPDVIAHSGYGCRPGCQGFVLVLDGKTGDKIWESSPLDQGAIHLCFGDLNRDGTVDFVVSSGFDFIYGLDGRDGALLWSYHGGDYIHMSSRILDINNDGILDVVTANDKGAYALNGETGTEIWTYTTNTSTRVWRNCVADVNGDGISEVIVNVNDHNQTRGEIIALDGIEGTPRWTYDSGYNTDARFTIDLTGDGSPEVIGSSNNDNTGDYKIFALTTIAPSVIIVLSPQNTTYTTSSIPLTFTVDKSTSWMGYSLDGEMNETIIGNTTLTVLLDGRHFIVVYANDTVGNMDSSDIIHFTVDTTPPDISNVSQIPLEGNVQPEDKAKVNVTVTDSLCGVKQVTLNYTNGNGTWITEDMTNLEVGKYNATIPAFEYCTNVTYVIIAKDKAGNTITTEHLGYEYQYHVVPEFLSTVLVLFIAATFIAVIITKTQRKPIA